MKKLFFVFTLGIFIFGCQKNQNSVAESAELAKSTESTKSQEAVETAKSSSEKPKSETENSSGKTEETEIRRIGIMTDTNVNIRKEPSVQSEKVGKAYMTYKFKVTAISKNLDTIEGTQGPWVQVEIPYNGEKGWIFSKYITVKELPNFPKTTARPLSKVNNVRIKKVNEPEQYQHITIDVETDRKDGSTFTENIIPGKLPTQDFYTFSLENLPNKNIAEGPRGIFIWYPKTDEVYLVTDSIANYYHFDAISDDFNYLISDEGSAPGIRELIIYDINSNERIFFGTYFGDFEYIGGNEVTIIDPPNADRELEKQLKKEFDEKTPYSKEDLRIQSLGLSVTTIARYRYNYIEKTTTFLDCQRVYMQ